MAIWSHYSRVCFQEKEKPPICSCFTISYTVISIKKLLASCQQTPSILHNFSIYYHNVGGLRTKNDNLFVKFSALDFDIIAISETWLTASHYISEYFDLNLFTVFRKDRCPVNFEFSRGGAVLIALQNRFSAKALDLNYKLSNADMDQLIISINVSKGCELLLFISYIPPGSSFVIYDTHFKNCSYYIDNLKPNQHKYVG